MRRNKMMKNTINLKKVIVQEVEAKVDMGHVFKIEREPYIITKNWDNGDLVYVLASLQNGNIWTDPMPLDKLAEYLQRNADTLNLEYCGYGIEGVKEALK